MILIRVDPGPFTLEDDEKQRLALEVVRDLLPNLENVDLSLAVIGLDVPEWQVSQVVDRALKKLGPLKDMPDVTVRGSSNEDKQGARIIRDVGKAFGCQ